MVNNHYDKSDLMMDIMKKVISICLCAVFTLLAACSSDSEGEQKKIQVNNEKELNQTLYADQQKGGISFVAEADWTTSVSESTATKAAATWVTLDPDHGGKGSYTVSINLEPNLTGQKRTATITITCGDTKITVTVTQEGTTESGDVPGANQNYLVSRIQEVYETVVAATGAKETSTTAYTFEYDSQNRITKAQEDETYFSGEKEMSGNTFTYGDNTIVMKSFSDDKTDEQDEATFTLGEDGNIVKYEIVEVESGSRSWYSAGTLTYDSEGYLTTAEGQVDMSSGEPENRVDMAVWKDGNLIRAYNDYYGTDQQKTRSEMEYANSEYINNPNVNLDLNFFVCDSEWLDCFAFGGAYIKPYGHIGKRSKNYMTAEYDKYHGDNEYCTYQYEFDEKGLPVKVIKTRHDKENYYSKNQITYTITYKLAQ
jgi:hypothetical protein